MHVRIKLTYKIFGAFLLTCVMIVVLMVGIIHFYMGRNFRDFINKMELEKLDNIVNALKEEHERDPGWTALRTDPHRLWRKMLRWSEKPPKSDLPVGIPSHLHPPGRPPDEIESIRRSGGIGRLLPRPPRDPLPILLRLTLVDAQERFVAGMPTRISEKSHTLRPIILDGKTLGWLALQKRERLSNPPALAFLKQQSQVYFLTGGGILLLASIVSFLLSKHLLAPIRELTMGTQALTSLKFDTRIQVRTGDELGQLAMDFNRMAETLSKYETMRKQWLSDISHELRTPLSVLRGEIEAMQDGVREITDEALESLHAEALHMGKIVDDLHELSLADSGALHMERKPIQPVAVLKETLKLFETRFQQAQISIAADLPVEPQCTMQGDASRLAQLYTNLLENTLRYADAPGTLRIGREFSSDQLSLFFEDSGPGVPQESVDHLFDRLYKVDASRTRTKGGSGLGLAICKAIAESHGASIHASSAPGSGLRIQILFPPSPHGKQNHRGKHHAPSEYSHR